MLEEEFDGFLAAFIFYEVPVVKEKVEVFSIVVDLIHQFR